MPNINIQISCEVDVSGIAGTVDFEKKMLSTEDVQKFISGELGEHYLTILIPNDDIFSEIQAKKTDMKKKGAIFEVLPKGTGVRVKVDGVFKVNAYSHVIDRIKANADNIFVVGIHCGDWPPYGGNFVGVDVEKNMFPIRGQLA